MTVYFLYARFVKPWNLCMIGNRAGCRVSSHILIRKCPYNASPFAKLQCHVAYRKLETKPDNSNLTDCLGGKEAWRPPHFS